MHRFTTVLLVAAALVGCNSNSRSGARGSLAVAPSTVAPTPAPPAPVASSSSATPVVVAPPPTYLVQRVAVTGSEFAGGWGIPPIKFPPPPPPPPTLSVTVTFANGTGADLDATDPTLALQVIYSLSPSGVVAGSAIVPLSASIAAGAQGDESYTFTLGAIGTKFWVEAALVRLDRKTGQIAEYLNPTGPSVAIVPPIRYPL